MRAFRKESVELNLFFILWGLFILCYFLREIVVEYFDFSVYNIEKYDTNLVNMLTHIQIR